MILPDNLVHKMEPILKESGKIIMSHFKKHIDFVLHDVGQITTEADIKVENFLKSELNLIFPEATFIAEESGKSGEGDYKWVIDPIDGTTNFLYGIPYFCTSVALTLNDKSILGMIYDPLRKELFFAEKNKGAFLNGNKIKVSSKNKLKDCLISTSIPCGSRATYAKQLETVKAIRCKSFSMRLLGAAALDLAQVACARVDATFFNKLKWWDIAAGYLLIEEAGGITTDFKGNEIGPKFNSFVAGSVKIHSELVNLLS